MANLEANEALDLIGDMGDLQLNEDTFPSGELENEAYEVIDHNASEENLNEALVPVLNRRRIFFENYKQPVFAFPDSIMYYIAKNPTHSHVWDRLIQQSKFFFVMNPIIVVYDLCYNDNIGWNTVAGWPLDLSGNVRVWTSSFYMAINSTVNRNIASSIVPKIYKNEARRVLLGNQDITVGELGILARKADELVMKNTKVVGPDNEALSFEKLVELFPHVFDFCCEVGAGKLTFSFDTVAEIVKLSKKRWIGNILLREVPDVFDDHGFWRFMQNNQLIGFKIYFAETVNEAFKLRIQKIIDEILYDKHKYYKPPYLWFPGLSLVKSAQLEKVFNREHTYP